MRGRLSSGRWPSCDVLPRDEAKARGQPLSPCTLTFERDGSACPAWPISPEPARLDPAKFQDARTTAKGEPRASVALAGLDTLWINTGTLCNLACANCFIVFDSEERPARLHYRGRGLGIS